ncbi:MAG: hypothetical protein U0414_16910 [Polyangiaceae bacterium]
MRPRIARGIWGTPRGNPPEQVEINYQVGNFKSFLDAMLEAAPIVTLPDGPFAGQRPLAKLDTSASGALGFEIFAAWATVCNVLAFYQERLFNEAFVGTATERHAQLSLLQSLHYAPRPAIAADVDLVFQLTPSDHPDLMVTIPKGSGTESVPTPGNAQGGAPPMPQVFETRDDLDGCTKWNELSLAVSPTPPSPPSIPLADHVCLLEGTGLQIGVGSLLLLTGSLEPSAPSADTWLVVRAESVAEDAATNTTTLSWSVAYMGSAETLGPTLYTPELRLFRQSARLFGYDAAVWRDLTLSDQLGFGVPIGGLWIADATLTANRAWRPAQRSLPDVLADIRCLLAVPASGAQGLELFAGTTADGVLSSVDLGASFQRASQGLLQSDIYSLAYDAAFGLVAGTLAGQVYRSVDRGTSWESISGGGIVLERKDGAFKAVNTNLPPAAVRAILITRRGEGDARKLVLLACSDAGVYTSDSSGVVWAGFNEGLPAATSPPDAELTPPAAVTAWCISEAPDGRLYLGTNGGLYERTADAPRWQLVAEVGARSILSMCVVARPTASEPKRVAVLLGTAGEGLLTYWPTTGEVEEGGLPSASSVNAITPLSLPNPAPASVARDDLLLAAVSAGADGGVFRSDDRGVTWLAIDDGLRLPVDPDFDPSSSNLDRVVAAAFLSPTGDLRLVSAAPLVGVGPRRDWPDYHMGGTEHAPSTEIDLDLVYGDLAPDTWLVLMQPDSLDPRKIEARRYAAGAVFSVFRRAFGVSGTITRVVADESAGLRSFDLRTATALVAPTRLTLAWRSIPPSEVLWGRKLEIEGQIPLFPYGRRLLVTGTRARAIDAGSGSEAYDLRCIERLPMVVGPRRMRLTIERAGRVEQLTQLEPLIELVADMSSGETHQFVTVESAEFDEPTNRTVVTVEEQLDPLQKSTVKIFGNVVAATNGETLKDMVLGNGNQSARNQTFALPTGPLTYVRVPGTTRLEADIRVSVSGVPWTRVDSLSAAGPSDRVYELIEDLGGVTCVRFGDGLSGARPPTGINNIVATYRHGAGPDGNVLAGTIVVLTNIPLGVLSVNNPLAAANGRAAQPYDAARPAATARVTSLDRVVTSTDFTNLLAALPEVTKVATFEIGRSGPGHLGAQLHVVTVADATEVPLDAAALALFTSAIESVSPMEARSRAQFVVRSFSLVYFALRARLVFHSTTLTREARDAVIAAAEDALAEAFGFRARDFAQAVTEAEIYRTLQDVPGVVAVELDALYRVGEADVLNPRLEASPPVFDGSTLKDAELLLLELDQLVIS